MADAALVRRVLDGDPGAYSAIVDRYYERCARFAFRMLGHREDAEDAVQEAFLRAYRALGRYEERDVFRAWLFRILVNQCRTSASRRRRTEHLFVGGDEIVHEVAGSSRADVVLVAEDVQRAIAELEPLLREAFLLRYVEQLDYREMSAVTGAGISALKMRVKRACDALRARLEDRRDEA
jgi:RNA polymerase sigma-70 factor (ECF subfamily)